MTLIMKQLRQLTVARHAGFRAVGRLLLGLASLGLLTAAGCSGGGVSIIGITPSTPQVLDVGQTLSIEASVVNDTTGQGANFTLTGVGSLGSVVKVLAGESDFNTAVYSTPSAVTGTTTATVTASSAHTPSQTALVSITINPALAITTTSLPGGTIGTAYSTTLAAAGGSGAYTWSGTLPTGLSLNASTGAITGTPANFGSSTVTLSVTDHASTPVTVSQTYTLTILSKPPVVTTTSLPTAVVGTAYSQQLTYSGGNGAAPAWAVASGTLPVGVTLNTTTGLLSGTPALADAGTTYTFAITVTVGTQTSTAQPLSIIVPGLPVVTTTSLPSGNVGIKYSQTLAYTGGAGGTVTWAIASGSLPLGLQLNTTTGIISGTPMTQNPYNFSVAVTVGTQTSASQSLLIAIYSLIVTSSATALGETGLPFSFDLTAQGGTGPYTWSVLGTGNALPAGLILNTATGVISGMLTTPATTTNVVVQAKDTLGATATLAMTFSIAAARGTTNNSELSGQYAFLLNGFDASGNPLAVAGSFTGAATTNVALTGTFSVGADNRGKLTIVTASGTSTYVLSLDTVTSGVATAGYLTEFDGSGQTLTGVLALQTSSAFTTASITSGYAFGASGFAVGSTASALTHRSAIGEMQFTGAGGISSGEMLSSAAPTTTPLALSSAALTIAANGRGTVSVVRPSGASTLDFVVYVVSVSKLFMLSTDAASGSSAAANDLLSGTMQQETIANGNFNTSSLSGTAVMRSSSLASSSGSATPFSDVKVGLYSFNGASTASLSADENKGGTASTSALSGSYTVAANGRVAMLLAAGGLNGCTDCVGSGTTYAYLVGANQGFLMDFSAGASTGSFEPQTATGITAATLSGSYALGTLGPVVQGVSEIEGVLTSTGSGAITSMVDVNTQGMLTADAPILAAYVMASNGRATVTPVGSDNSVLYVVSATKTVQLDLQTTTPAVVEVAHQ